MTATDLSAEMTNDAMTIWPHQRTMTTKGKLCLRCGDRDASGDSKDNGFLKRICLVNLCWSPHDPQPAFEVAEASQNRIVPIGLRLSHLCQSLCASGLFALCCYFHNQSKVQIRILGHRKWVALFLRRCTTSAVRWNNTIDPFCEEARSLFQMEASDKSEFQQE